MGRDKEGSVYARRDLKNILDRLNSEVFEFVDDLGVMDQISEHKDRPASLGLLQSDTVGPLDPFAETGMLGDQNLHFFNLWIASAIFSLGKVIAKRM